MKSSIKVRVLHFCILILVLAFFPLSQLISSADTQSIIVTGQMYEFDGETEYPISKAETVKADPFGSFFISADIASQKMMNGVQAYYITGSKMSLFYNHTDDLLTANEAEWHLHSDDGDEIDGREMESSVAKGAIILQTSKDRINWSDVFYKLNAFEETPIRTEPVYEATDIELINGCYYRLTIAYETARKTGRSGWWFFQSDDIEYLRHAEVYEFFAQREDSVNKEIDKTRVYNVGTLNRVEDFASYKGTQEIEKDDPHYGWKIGQFFVSGQTSTTKDENGNTVILKNVGDEICLWFRLDQNINSLNGNKSLSINADDDWYDGYFQTARTNSGRGVLIVKHTDYTNEEKKPVIYTNYLEASATIGADTKIQVFEEGDYEVALDYEIREDKLIDKYYHYRLSFSFIVRNGNCMVYPLDSETGGELLNGMLTENGFKLDMAKSRYLNIVVKKETLRDGGDSLIEDTRFNKVARDGEIFNDEGVYVITVTNQYTGAEPTVKKIYVGTNPVLKAYVATGLSVPEINQLVLKGAEIKNDGSIVLAQNTDTGENSMMVVPVVVESAPEAVSKEIYLQEGPADSFPQWLVICLIVAVIVLIVVLIFVLIVWLSKRRKLPQQKNEERQKEESLIKADESQKDGEQ